LLFFLIFSPHNKLTQNGNSAGTGIAKLFMGTGGAQRTSGIVKTSAVPEKRSHQNP